MRKTDDFIRNQRRDRKGAILVTGITSFLGSHISVELLREGYFLIFLCRGKDEFSAPQRVEQILQWFGYERRDGFKVIEGRIDEDRLGLDQEVYSYLLDNVAEIIHCVADTSFASDKKEQLNRVNVGGARNLLDLATAGNCYFFHFVSTAYSVGKLRETCLEEYQPRTEFNNYYEESKNVAEGMVLQQCKQAGVRASIYRPSIVFGDSETGKSLIFNALYHPVRILGYLRDKFYKDIQQSGGVSAGKMGVEMVDDKLRMPIRIAKTEDATLNIIPIDYVKQAFCALFNDCVEGDIFHIVAGEQPSRLDDWIEYSSRYFGFTGVQPVLENDFERVKKNPLERLFDSYIDVYRPFLLDERKFDDRKTQAVLKKRGISRPMIDYASFARCIDYAVGAAWGDVLSKK